MLQLTTPFAPVPMQGDARLIKAIETANLWIRSKLRHHISDNSEPRSELGGPPYAVGGTPHRLKAPHAMRTV